MILVIVIFAYCTYCTFKNGDLCEMYHSCFIKHQVIEKKTIKILCNLMLFLVEMYN